MGGDAGRWIVGCCAGNCGCAGKLGNQLYSLSVQYITSSISDYQHLPDCKTFNARRHRPPPPLLPLLATHTTSEEPMEPTRRSERLQKTTQGAATPTNIRNQNKRTERKHRDPVALPIEDDPPPGETNPARVNRPISTAVHENLKNAWTINKALPMCFIFDFISPARQFKWGTPFDEQGEFPEYNDKDLGDVTETDGDPIAWMPYAPREYP
jgi:hypothetical protein